MTIKQLVDSGLFKPVNIADDSREISKVFCCDLLSVAMSKAPADGCWITVMANINTLAVASLTDCSCIVIAEGTVVEAQVLDTAVQQGISLFQTDLPIFDAGLKVQEKL